MTNENEHTVTTPRRVINQTIKYWQSQMEFIQENQEYCDLIEFIEEVQDAKVDKKLYKRFYIRCLEVFNRELDNQEEFVKEQNLKLNELFDCVKKFHVIKDDESYIKLLNHMTKFQGTWDNFLRFMDWWNVKNFKISHKIERLKSNWFDQKITVEEGYYLACATAILENFKKRNINSSDSLNKIYSKKEIRQVNKFLIKLRQLNNKDHKNELTLKHEFRLLLIFGKEKDNFNYFIKNIAIIKGKVGKWKLLAANFKENPKVQLRFLSQLLKVEDVNIKKIEILRKIYRNFQTLNMRMQAKSTSELIIDYCAKQNLKTINDDAFKDTLDDLLCGVQSDRQGLLKYFKQYSKDAREILSTCDYSITKSLQL